MNTFPVMLGALCVYALAYRYYSAFIAAKALALDDRRTTPAHLYADGHNYVVSPRWVLFGHHFAAIAGAGPLVGPTLAAQFGFAPGFLWILVGAVLAGCVQDFTVLVASVRHRGRSLADVARTEISPFAGLVAMIAVLFILLVTLAGLGIVVVNALSNSPWGVFTIGMTIPIAVVMGLWMFKSHTGKITVTGPSIFGVVLLVASVVAGHWVAQSGFAGALTFSPHQITVMMAIYGLVASVLPVWLVLEPRDYLSTYVKLGTIVVLIIGVFIVHPNIQFPNFTPFIHGGGPIIKGKLFPFLFVTIACGAISGFHSLVASGTTPKMLDKESDARFIGYGAMVAESLVGVLALIAACSLYPRPAWDGSSDGVLVSLRHYVRSAFYSDYHRHWDARGALCVAGANGQGPQAIRQQCMAAGESDYQLLCGSGLGILNLHRQYFDVVAIVWNGQSATGNDRPGSDDYLPDQHGQEAICVDYGCANVLCRRHDADGGSDVDPEHFLAVDPKAGHGLYGIS